MALRIIVKDPDPVLREVAKPVSKITPNILKLLTDMADTMYDADGVGLAAPQIGISKRVIVVDVGDEHGLVEMINPEIVEKEGEQVGAEGCLSIPNLNGEVKRAFKVRVKALDREGNPFELVGEELMARALQHEIDHLNGILFTDLATNLYDANARRRNEGPRR
jgi:peptide deformylase